MKLRNGFVSNSSSSSFVCDICGCNEIGHDTGPNTADMFECENGHTICHEHVENYINEKYNDDILQYVKTEYDLMDKVMDNASCYRYFFGDGSNSQVKEFGFDEEIYTQAYKDYDEYRRVLDDLGGYQLDPELCPICNFTNILSDDLVKYIIKKDGKNYDKIISSIKSEFDGYESFKEFLK